MPPKTRIQIAKADIVNLFQEYPRRVFSQRDIEEILSEKRSFWRLTQSTTVNDFVNFMTEHTDLQAVRWDFPNRPANRYTWGEVPLLELVQSLKPEGYFTHYSALQIHGLTSQIPKTVYFNIEQRASGGAGQLSQARIDQAFRRKCRVSKNVAAHRDHRICLLNGQNTGQLGVVSFQTTDGSGVRVSGIERTLIDAVVRPVYSGGVFEVARAFEMARDRFSVNKLVATLRKLDYTYPYHQAVGFYLEHAGGYRKAQVELLRQFDLEYDFYLAHDMKDTDYNQKWRLFIPKDF